MLEIVTNTIVAVMLAANLFGYLSLKRAVFSHRTSSEISIGRRLDDLEETVTIGNPVANAGSGQPSLLQRVSSIEALLGRRYGSMGEATTAFAAEAGRAPNAGEIRSLMTRVDVPAKRPRKAK